LYARLVAGLAPNDFIDVEGDELVEWDVDASGILRRYHRDWGWSDARLITGLDYANFLEVKNDGSLYQWTWNGSGYSGRKVGNGWANYRLIAGLTSNTFVGVLGDELIKWQNNGSGYQWHHLDWGWSNAQFIAGLNADQFVEVKTNTELWTWTGTGSGFSGVQSNATITDIQTLG